MKLWHRVVEGGLKWKFVSNSLVSWKRRTRDLTFALRMLLKKDKESKKGLCRYKEGLWHKKRKKLLLCIRKSLVRTFLCFPTCGIKQSLCHFQPDVCQTDFDAVSMIRGELFFFKSGYVWRIRDGHLESGYPALASRHWRGIPANIDAAFEDKSGNIWFFRGEISELYFYGHCYYLKAGKIIVQVLRITCKAWFSCKNYLCILHWSYSYFRCKLDMYLVFIFWFDSVL